MSTPAPPPSVNQERLVSLDALRGFDMFWIAFGEKVVEILHKHYEWGPLNWLHHELEHPLWHGFTFYDLIFPLFMFLSGVSFSFSLNKRRRMGESDSKIHWHVLQRGILLVIIGFIFNGLLTLDFAGQRYPSVLGRIGLGYMGGAFIAMHFQNRGRIIWAAGLLLGYWILMKYIPVPGFGTGIEVSGETWEGYLDRMLIPGDLYVKDEAGNLIRDPEGIISTFPSIVNVLAGIMTGDWLRRGDKSGYEKVTWMALVGAILWGAAKLWDFNFPINKNLWTSSFVLITVGWSLMLLALFYLIIDVWKVRWWTFFFVVIGSNSLFIYLVGGFIDFEAIVSILFRKEGNWIHPDLVIVAALALKWLLLYYMYRKKIFLRL